jgi:rhomboid protease GluP
MIYRAIPNDISLYEKNMQQLSMLENKALHALRLPGDTPKEERLSALQQGITDWNKAEQIIRTSEKLQLPPIIRERDKELLHYCDLRLKVYQWVYLSVNENSGAYLEQIREGTREIKQSLIKLRSK